MRIFLRATTAPVRFERPFDTTPNVPSPSLPVISKSVIFAQPENMRLAIEFAMIEEYCCNVRLMGIDGLHGWSSQQRSGLGLCQAL